MTCVAVIGNGESRRRINLQALNLPLIGCNAIHRDLKVDHLIVCDRKMIHECIDSANTVDTKIYVRPENYHHFRKMVKDKRINKLPELFYQGNLKSDEPRNWGSGGFALILAAELDYENIVMLGFDLYGINERINNIYKDSNNYLDAQKPAVDPSYWIYQIEKIFNRYQDKDFVIYNEVDWKIPPQWRKKNVSVRFLHQLDVDNK